MQSVVKFIGVAVTALALSGTLSACQPKAAQTLKGIEAYLIENPYHEQSEIEQVKSLLTLVDAMNHEVDVSDVKSVRNTDISGHFEADTSRDMIIMYGFIEKPVTAKQLKTARKIFIKEKNTEQFCTSPGIIALNTSGIGMEIIAKTRADDFLYQATCPGVSAEMYALGKKLN